MIVSLQPTPAEHSEHAQSSRCIIDIDSQLQASPASTLDIVSTVAGLEAHAPAPPRSRERNNHEITESSLSKNWLWNCSRFFSSACATDALAGGPYSSSFASLVPAARRA
jgi:hypothetical protein